MTPADRQTLAKKMEYLRKQLELLEEYKAVPKSDLLSSVEKRLVVERLLELCLQSVIDCSRMLVAMEDWRGIRDDRDALVILEEKKVIDDGLCQRLLRAKGFRNVLVHEYVEIDPELLYTNFKNGLPDVWSFLQCLAERL